MKAYRLILAGFAALGLAACSDIDDIEPKSGTMLATQVQQTNAEMPTRAEASFNGMFTNIGYPAKIYSYPDDWEFLMINFCNDLEGADAWIADSGYNWFSVCGEYSSRNADYRNPAIRYRVPYNMIGDVNTFLAGFADDVADPSILNMIAQAKALRAYSYLALAPNFSFGYSQGADQPSVPILTADVDVTNNPRASIGELYDYIINDLTEAIDALETADIKAVGRTSKMYIDAQVAHGLRARAYLATEQWQNAYDDAVAAAQGYTPATIAEVSKPSFMDISEHEWIWGYDMTEAVAANYAYATTSAWLRSFSNNSYSAACQVYTCINKLLWDKIPSTDVRKGWWVDENLESPLLDGLVWPGFSDVANANDGNNKQPYIPYTNVKFGCNPIATDVNSEDMPLMRVEEMILIQAECQARLGNTSQATSILTNFVQTYRDPSYDVSGRGLSLLDEIWFQRRVELWGEGFFIPDQRRLNKPIVRFHGVSDTGDSFPEAFRFNLAPDDPWLKMRFPQGEMNTNFGIVDNDGGALPVVGSNGSLRDGVTD